MSGRGRNGTVMGCQTASGRYTEWFVGDPQESRSPGQHGGDHSGPCSRPCTASEWRGRTSTRRSRSRQTSRNVKSFNVGGFRADSAKDLKFRTLFELAGVNFKYVTGYQGSADLLSAFLRGELDYIDGSTPFYIPTGEAHRR